VRAPALTILMVVAAIAPATADTAGREAERACLDAGLDAGVCALLVEVEDGAARAGLSAGDFSDDPAAAVTIADFYFEPRLTMIRNGQTITFRNDNLPGGNPHSVSSADVGGDSPVLAPGGEFGGGRGFRSGRLAPGDPFFLTIDLATLDPAAYLVLPDGSALISYHCYVHGAGQMQGQIVVEAVSG
jgi:plastocyanin